MLWRKSATWRIFINSVAGRGMAVPPCHAMPRLVAEFAMAIYIPDCDNWRPWRSMRQENRPKSNLDGSYHHLVIMFAGQDRF